MKKLMMILAVAAATHCGFSAFLPEVGNGTEPNKWTRNMAGVLEAAKKTGYPIFLTMLNEAADGEGCSHCHAFVQNTINTAAWKSLVADYKFYMVLLNRWGLYGGEIFDAAHGSVSNDTFQKYWRMYAASSGFPLVAVIRSNGSRYKYWLDPQTRGTNMPGYIREAIAALAPNDSIFSLSSVSSVSVSEGGSWKGKIVRTGKSGQSGTVTLSLSGTHADRYTVTPNTISWDGSDGEKTVEVTGPSTKDGILSDTITLGIAASGFGSSKISYGTQKLTLSFKDSSIGKTLAEFSASSGISTLSSGSIWYVPAKADGNVLETSTTGSASLTWTAAAAGVLSVAGNVSDAVSMKATLKPVSGEAETFDLAADVQTVGVAAGDRLVVTATVSGANEAQKIGFKTLSFSKITVTASSPDDGEAFSRAALKSDASLVDLKWNSSTGGLDYEVFANTNGAAFSGAQVYSGTGMSVNVIDSGYLSVDSFVGECAWGVRAMKAADYGKACATATAAFSIASGPAYPGSTPSSVTLFQKGDAELDFSAQVADGAAAVSYSVSSGKLPSGLVLNKNTGVIRGTPTRTGKYSATITATSSEGTQSIDVSFTVGKFPSELKGEYNGIFFDSRQNMVGSITWKVSKNGKVTGTILREGKKTKIKGGITVDENSAVIFGDDNISISLVSGSTSVWGGTFDGLQLYGTKTGTSFPAWTGNWNVGMGASSNGAMAGYATAKIAKKGTAKMSVKIMNKYKLSAKGSLLVLDKAFVDAHLSKWSRGGSVAFAQAFKKSSGRKFNGGFAFYVNGSATETAAMADFMGTFFDESNGSRWNRPAFTSLNGAVATTAGGIEEVSFPVKATEKKLSAGSNSCSAKIGGKTSTGVFKGSYSAGGTTHKYEGILFMENGEIVGFGGGNAGVSNPFAIEIGGGK